MTAPVTKAAMATSVPFREQMTWPTRLPGSPSPTLRRPASPHTPAPPRPPTRPPPLARGEAHRLQRTEVEEQRHAAPTPQRRCRRLGYRFADEFDQETGALHGP